MEAVNYVVYVTSSQAHPVGTVVNVVLIQNLTLWSPPAGFGIAADPQRKYPIGSVYPGALS